MKVTVSENTTTGVVTATTPGPQGAKGIELNETAKVDKSVVDHNHTHRRGQLLSHGQHSADQTPCIRQHWRP
jgi:hypothetical protein